MTDPEHEDLTSFLNRLHRGDQKAQTEVFRIVYEKLMQIAHARLALESPGGTLQTSDLVHEAYIRLVGDGPDDPTARWENRRHFYGAAAEAMRRILIDNARKRQALKRGGDRKRALYQDMEAPGQDVAADFIDLQDMFDALEENDERAYQVVRLRYFLRLTVEETADILGISPRTVKKDWAFAKAWIRKQLGKATSS